MRGSVITCTLRWLDDHARTGAERRAVRWIWARHATYHSALFRGCGTRAEVIARLSDAPCLLREPWVGPRTVALLQGVLMHALTLEES